MIVADLIYAEFEKNCSILMKLEDRFVIKYHSASIDPVFNARRRVGCDWDANIHFYWECDASRYCCASIPEEGIQLFNRGVHKRTPLPSLTIRIGRIALVNGVHNKIKAPRTRSAVLYFQW